MINQIKKLLNSWGKSKPEPGSNDLVCPNCNYKKFSTGPEGGLSVNIWCGQCGSRYNYSPFGLDTIEIRNEHKDIIRDEKLRKLLE